MWIVEYPDIVSDGEWIPTSRTIADLYKLMSSVLLTEVVTRLCGRSKVPARAVYTTNVGCSNEMSSCLVFWGQKNHAQS